MNPGRRRVATVTGGGASLAGSAVRRDQVLAASWEDLRNLLAAFQAVPPYEADPGFYVDWGASEAFQVQVGKGECAQ